MSTNSFQFINRLIIKLKLCYSNFFLKLTESIFHLLLLIFFQRFLDLKDLVLTFHEQLYQNSFDLGLVFDVHQCCFKLLPLLAYGKLQDLIDSFFLTLAGYLILIILVDSLQLFVCFLNFQLKTKEYFRIAPHFFKLSCQVFYRVFKFLTLVRSSSLVLEESPPERLSIILKKTFPRQLSWFKMMASSVS